MFFRCIYNEIDIIRCDSIMKRLNALSATWNIKGDNTPKAREAEIVRQPK